MAALSTVRREIEDTVENIYQPTTSIAIDHPRFAGDKVIIRNNTDKNLILIITEARHRINIIKSNREFSLRADVAELSYKTSKEITIDNSEFISDNFNLAPNCSFRKDTIVDITVYRFESSGEYRSTTTVCPGRVLTYNKI